MSLLGLALQGLLMGWVAYRMGPPSSLGEWITLTDLVLLRGVWAPAALYGVLHRQGAPARQDLIPPNLLSWTIAVGMVLVASNFADTLIGESGPQQTLLRVAAAGVLIGLVVLATQSQPFGQIVGVLRVENAIALFELGGDRHPRPTALHVGQLAVFALTVGLYRGTWPA